MGLQEDFRNERVNELELRDPVTVPTTAALRDALSLMREHDIGSAIVVDDDQKPIGIFTESMLTEMLAKGAVEIDEAIEKYMVEQLPLVRTTDPIAAVLEVMQQKQVRSVCVVDEQDRVVGVTGQRGLMQYVADRFPGQVVVQRIGQPPYYSNREGA